MVVPCRWLLPPEKIRRTSHLEKAVSLAAMILRETAACGSACLRAAAPPSSLASFLSSFGGCAASFYYPLRASLSSCGRLRRPSSLLLLSRFLQAAAPPYPFRFSSSSPRFFGGCAASHYPALSWAAGAAPLALSSFLSIKQLTNP